MRSTCDAPQQGEKGDGKKKRKGSGKILFSAAFVEKGSFFTDMGAGINSKVRKDERWFFGEQLPRGEGA
jgi:hypothetical protein